MHKVESNKLSIIRIYRRKKSKKIRLNYREMYREELEESLVADNTSTTSLNKIVSHLNAKLMIIDETDAFSISFYSGSGKVVTIDSVEVVSVVSIVDEKGTGDIFISSADTVETMKEVYGLRLKRTKAGEVVVYKYEDIRAKELIEKHKLKKDKITEDIIDYTIFNMRCLLDYMLKDISSILFETKSNNVIIVDRDQYILKVGLKKDAFNKLYAKMA